MFGVPHMLQILEISKINVSVLFIMLHQENMQNFFKEPGILKSEDINKCTTWRFLLRWYIRKLTEMFNEYLNRLVLYLIMIRDSPWIYVAYIRTNLSQSCISYCGPNIKNSI